MRKLNLITLFFAVILLSSCAGLKKMKKEANKIKYQVNPKVLVEYANMVDVKIQVTIPPKYFAKKVVVEATPVLKFKGGEQAFDTKILQGEKVKGNNMVVPFNTGKTIHYVSKMPYKNAMRISGLYVRLKGKKGKKSVDFESDKLADGILATATLVINNPQTILAKDAFQKVISDRKEADLFYLINSAKVRSEEGKKEDIQALKDYVEGIRVSENKEYKGLEISAYASPDGKEEFNARLAANREKTSTKFLKKEMKRAGLENFTAKSLMKSRVTPEDWEGFQKLMKNSDIRDKDLILRVLAMYTDPEVREKEMRNIASVFDEIKDVILPKLRKAKFIVNVDIIGKSDEDLIDLALHTPVKLNIEELLYTATICRSNKNKLDIYESVKKQFPNDWRGFNNAGVILFAQDNLEQAKTNFEQADQLDPNNGIVKNNLGAIALKNSKIEEAEILLGAATGAGQEVDYNKGIIAIKKGDYNGAVQNFEKSNSVNGALADILTENYNGALAKLDNGGNQSAIAFYLRAVAAARTDNKELVYSNLMTAVSKSSTMKYLAETDLNFAKYFEDKQFKAITAQ